MKEANIVCKYSLTHWMSRRIMSYMQPFVPSYGSAMFPGNPSSFSVKNILNLAEQQQHHNRQASYQQQGVPMDPYYYGLQDECMMSDPGSMSGTCEFSAAPVQPYTCADAAAPAVDANSSAAEPVSAPSSGSSCSFHPNAAREIKAREVASEDSAPTTTQGGLCMIYGFPSLIKTA